MALLDQLPNLPNPLHKSVLNLRSLKSISLNNSECPLRCLRQRRACHHSRCFRFRQRKCVRMPSLLLLSRRCKYMPNCKLRHRFKHKHKVHLRLFSAVYLLVRTSRHRIIPGQRRLRPVLVSHSKPLPLGLLSRLPTLVPLRVHRLPNLNCQYHHRRSSGTPFHARRIVLQRIIYQWYHLAHILHRNKWTRR